MSVTDTSPRFRLPRFLKWSLLGGVGIVYACLFGEAFLRLLDPQLRMPRYITGTEYGIRGNIPKAREHLPDRPDGGQLFHGL